MKLIVYFRYMQFYAHMAHNYSKGETFFQDHDFFGELYSTYEGVYDKLVEKFIGLDKDLDLVKVHQKAAGALKECKSSDESFKELLMCEEAVCEACKEMSKEATLGLGNLLAQIADDSESRQYKIKQRLKEDENDKD
jgi:DNA-binding ferritin-like protein